MKIGIIGTGFMGKSLGGQWARAGHQVLFGSRDAAKARGAADLAGGAAAGDFDAAARFAEVVLYTVRDVPPSRLLRDPTALAGKVVLDCNNADLGDGSRPGEFRFDGPRPSPSLAERLAAGAPGARVVKAFNTIPYKVIELARDELAAHRVSVFLCGDDRAARAGAAQLAEDIGFAAVDCGPLRNAWMLEAAADLLRLQIGPMGLGMFATLSVHVLPHGQPAGGRS